MAFFDRFASSGKAKTEDRRRNNRGNIMLMVIGLLAFGSLVTIATIRFISANLRSTTQAERLIERDTAAEGALRLAIGQLALGVTNCLLDEDAEFVLPSSPGSDVVSSYSCDLVNNDTYRAHRWAVVLTGENQSAESSRMTRNSAAGGRFERINGSVFATSSTSPADIFVRDGTTTTVQNHSVFVGRDFCSDITIDIGSALSFAPSSIFGAFCTETSWVDVAPTPDMDIGLLGIVPRNGSESLAVNPASGSYEDVDSCRVFHPGIYSTSPNFSGVDHFYFKNGAYIFNDASISVPAGKTAIFGRPNASSWDAADREEFANRNLLVTGSPCAAVQSEDPALTGGDGALVYLAGSSSITVDGVAEFHGRSVLDSEYRGKIQNVSVQTLCSPAEFGETCSRWFEDGGDILSANNSTPPLTVFSVGQGADAGVVMHGTLYAPYSQVLLRGGGQGQLLRGGVVASTLDWLGSSAEFPNIGYDIGFQRFSRDAGLLDYPSVSDVLVWVKSVDDDGLQSEGVALVELNPFSSALGIGRMSQVTMKSWDLVTGRELDPGIFVVDDMQWELYSIAGVPVSEGGGIGHPNSRAQVDFVLSHSNAERVSQGRAAAGSFVFGNRDPGTTILDWTNAAQAQNLTGGAPLPNSNSQYAFVVSGLFIPEETGTYRFSVTSKDTVDFTITEASTFTGPPLIAHYGARNMPAVGSASTVGSVELEAGKIYNVRIRHVDRSTNGNGLRVFWEPPGQTAWYQSAIEMKGSGTPN